MAQSAPAQTFVAATALLAVQAVVCAPVYPPAVDVWQVVVVAAVFVAAGVAVVAVVVAVAVVVVVVVADTEYEPFEQAVVELELKQEQTVA